MLNNDRRVVLASSILEARRLRMAMLPSEIFGEPAWDLLLELFMADAAGERLTGRDCAKRCSISQAVLSRWLMHLSKLGLLDGDGTGNIDDELTLSGTAMDAMEQILEKSSQLGSPII